MRIFWHWLGLLVFFGSGVSFLVLGCSMDRFIVPGPVHGLESPVLDYGFGKVGCL